MGTMINGLIEYDRISSTDIQRELVDMQKMIDDFLGI
jgi:hypothetical protein